MHFIYYIYSIFYDHISKQIIFTIDGSWIKVVVHWKKFNIYMFTASVYMYFDNIYIFAPFVMKQLSTYPFSYIE